MNQLNQIPMRINPEKQSQRMALFNLAFRPFFLLGALVAVLYIFLWVSVYSGNVNITVYGGVLWWHVHEMLFGFVGAIIVGFLLTAVQTWTQIPGVKGLYLLSLVMLWIAGRIAMFTVGLVHPGWIALIDLSFLPVVALTLSIPIIERKMWRNLIFVPILLLMTYTNAYMHCAVFLPGSAHLTISAHNQVLLVVLLMIIIGGRVIPMFTANGTGTERVQVNTLVEKAAIGSMLLVVLVNMIQIHLPSWLVTVLYSLAAVFNAIRVFRWRIWVTWRTPMVLFLHISYWCIPIGLMLYGFSEFTVYFKQSQAIHSLTVGAMGVMILSMISRVSLGHTGRPILAGKMMTCAFVSIFMAFIVRVFGGGVFDYTYQLVISAGFWVLGFSLFLTRYTSILTGKRVDGKPG